jgi:hypothetical protein
MSDRRRFLKSIAGALVASAMPKSLLNDKPKVKFHEPKPTTGILAYVEKHGTTISYEEIKEMRVKKFSERLEKAMWAGSHDLKK